MATAEALYGVIPYLVSPTDSEGRIDGAALERLDPRSRDIVQRRWLNDDKPTLHELAAEYQVSAERIRQLETNAMKKLRAALPVAA